MKLVGRYNSPFVRRVGVTLHVLGLPFEHVPLSPFSQAAEFRQVSPVGRMPALVLADGETLIESAAILDYLDEMVGDAQALIPPRGVERRRSLRILGAATAACDKAIAINYERRRPAALISIDWISRCRMQLEAALDELESFGLQFPSDQRLMQVEITTACAYAYIERVEPDAIATDRCPKLAGLSGSCEGLRPFRVCPQ